MLSRFVIASTIVATLVRAGPVIQVSPQTKYQQYDGTGISEAFQRSLVMHELNLASEKIVLDYLFSNTTGAGFTILRNGLGSSPTEGYDLMKSIAPVAPASNSSKIDFQPFSREDQYQIWLSSQAISRGVHTVYADAWSADGYMKTQGTDFNGGYLCGVTNATCASGDWRQAYANKIVRYINNYKSHGITIDFVGFLNEPDLNTTYASMQSSGQQAADFIKILYPTLQKAGLTTQIACCDGSGWEQQRERLTGVQQAGYENEIGLVTSHGYSSKPGAPFNTPKKVWQTEWSTFDPLNFDWYRTGSQSEGLTWANNVQRLFGVSNVTGHLYWWGAANDTDNQALIYINGTSTVKPTKRLWAHAHFGSRLVRKGATRIGATVTGNAGPLSVTAFANTDGTTAVQVINNGDNAETVTLQGLKLNTVVTYLTNQASNFTVGNAVVSGSVAACEVPGRSLLSFYIR
ncbi:(Trans)glycosidase [Glarea lozoyensis ATCC 20868]|uniref:(Trans)glycosidase n=1 Tax=Glarea lozoyensis (strain ATCC 20868 / MF5171) TaxID=1116229 RepID=S3D8F1_GLAL2|nr:(Trans)glycosidase [Glarea lozoyensis ATCC 20868]EPE34762.1 (Trans)glycosidase [Glarea lozoyensis ATCC 20868]